MKILLFGKNGQVGWELQRSLAQIGSVVALGHNEESGLVGDLCDLQGVRETCRSVRPDVIVNAAAYTAVDNAENERDNAELINGLAPGVMADEAKILGALLVHYSTDYVFDGSGLLPWREVDATAPLNIYGQTKLMGEQAILSSGCRHLIFRTSWVYGLYGRNFVKTILNIAGRRESINVVDDQVGAPTSADFLADVTAHALHWSTYADVPSGLFHLVASGETSWYDYAKLIVTEATRCGYELAVRHIEPVSSRQYPSLAKRPLNSRLSTEKFESCFGLRIPSWEVGVGRVVQEMAQARLQGGAL